jgi:DNA-binding transcriptional ArsR family regulator
MRIPRSVSDVTQLKALSHPLRVRLLYALTAEGTATASKLGQLVDESPASVSYHLHKLADAGFVLEAPDAGSDGRERWWRVPEEGFSWSPADFDSTPEERSTSIAAKRALVDNQFVRQREYDAIADSWGEQWVHAAFSTDYVLRLSADETAEMSTQIRAVMDSWKELSLSRTHGADDDREHVMVFAHGFPHRP